MVVWSTIEASCPICKNRLRLREVGSGFALGQDSDLFVRMKGKHIIQAEIHTCHQCRYSGFADDFLRDVAPETRIRFLRDVAPQLVDEGEVRLEAPTPRKLATRKGAATKAESQKEDQDSGDTESAKRGVKKSRKGLARKRRTTAETRSNRAIPLHPCKRTPMPHVQYHWAAKTGEVLGLSPHEQGERLLRAYWCLRISPSSKLPARSLKQLRKRYLTEAIRKFRQGLRNQKDPNVVYLVAELCRRNGNFLLATGYFRRYFERGNGADEYLRQASEKLFLVAKEKLSTELAMEDVLYDPAPEKDDE